MIRVLGSRQRTCEGPSRREVLAAGSLGLLGISLPQVLAAQAATAARPRARGVILVFLFGAPSHQDTFDMKPEAPSEVRGEFRPIRTSAEGIRFCEHLPQTARHAHRLAVIRSLHHSTDSHSAAALLAMSGRLNSADPSKSLVAQPDDPPSMGSVCEHLARGRRTLPAYVFMPHLLGKYQAADLGGGFRPGPFAGFLGRACDPFATDCAPSKPSEPAELLLPELTPPPQLTLDRLDRRRGLLRQVDRAMRAAEDSPALRALSRAEQRAFDLTTSAAARAAFDLSREPDALRDRYGRNRYGNSLLQARRLIEAGVRFVTVSWDVILPDYDYDAWDTHNRNFAILKERNLPVFDRGFSALLSDLESRGLLEETLVLCMGEYGRTPRVNRSGGRDHWPFCYSALMAGAGVRGGTVHGASDAEAAYPAEDPVTPQDIVATVYDRLGIPLDTQIRDASGRPYPLVDHGRPLAGILT